MSFCGFRVAGFVSAWLSIAILAAAPACAQTMGTMPLSILATQSIRTSLTDTLRGARGNDTKAGNAISGALLAAIADHGPEAAATIASIVIVVAETNGASAMAVGNGLGQASVNLAPASCRGDGGNPAFDCRIAATAIAQALASEGRAEQIIAYQKTVIGLEYPKLARLAGSWVAPTGAINGGGGGGGSFSSGGGAGGGFIPGGGAPGGCLTASCTHL